MRDQALFEYDGPPRVRLDRIHAEGPCRVLAALVANCGPAFRHPRPKHRHLAASASVALWQGGGRLRCHVGNRCWARRATSAGTTFSIVELKHQLAGRHREEVTVFAFFHARISAIARLPGSERIHSRSFLHA